METKISMATVADEGTLIARGIQTITSVLLNRSISFIIF